MLLQRSRVLWLRRAMLAFSVVLSLANSFGPAGAEEMNRDLFQAIEKDLLDKGADRDAKARRGETAVKIAQVCGHKEIEGLLGVGRAK